MAKKKTPADSLTELLEAAKREMNLLYFHGQGKKSYLQPKWRYVT